MVLLALQVGLLLWWGRELPPEVPLFYGRPWGAAMLASGSGLWLLPLSAVGIAGLNGFLGGLMYSKDKLAARILLAVAALACGLSSFALGKILLLVL